MEILERWERNNLRQLERLGNGAQLIAGQLIRAANLILFLLFLALRTALRLGLFMLSQPKIVRARGPGLRPETSEEFERIDRRYPFGPRI